MQASNLFAAPIVTIFSTEHSIWSEIQLYAVNEWKMSMHKTYIKPKKLCWTSWILLELSTLMGKPFSKTWLSSTLDQFACKKKASKTRIQQNGLESIFPLGFHFLKSCERTSFPLPLWSSSSRYFLHRWSWKSSSPK